MARHAVAARFGARVVALGVLDEPSILGGEPVPLGAGGYKIARDEARLDDAHRRAVGVLSKFGARAAERGIDADLLEGVGDPVERILAEARRGDVVIVGRETNFHFETRPGPDSTLGHVIRASPRPVVVVPPAPADGRDILVAYSGGREVARTLQLFVLLDLAAAEIVDVVTVDRDAAKAEATAASASAFLTVHGQPHRVHALASGAAPVEVLLEEARRRRPRMLVMGAHGHHPLRDLFGTSVTRAVLEACPVPVFVGA
jgi:nucleotide-binding universal stress UspA family protein